MGDGLHRAAGAWEARRARVFAPAPAKALAQVPRPLHWTQCLLRIASRGGSGQCGIACLSHNPHLAKQLLPEPAVPSLAESAPTRSRAWFEMQLRPERPLACNVWHPGTTLPAGINAMRSANSNSTCSPTDSPLPGSYPIYPLDRNTAGQRPPNAYPASESLCHLRSTPLHGGKNLLPYLFQHLLIVPRCICHQVVERLVHAPNIVWSQARSHRLDTFAVSRQ
jgi:hypothetical protein